MFPAPVDGKLTMEMTRVIKAFNDSQQDVEVRGIFTGNYDTTKIKAESAQKAGQPPALVIMSANFTTDLALKDEILPMDDLFQYGDQKAGDFLVKEFWPAMHKNAQVMGTTYAIPFHNSTPILYYNKTMFDQAGIKQPPQTWAELLADAKKLTDESKGQWGSCCRRPTMTTAAGSSRRWYAPTAENTLTKTIRARSTTTRRPPSGRCASGRI
jgi:sn-glycerol 3-phosphate transport system substrate-binding protein